MLPTPCFIPCTPRRLLVLERVGWRGAHGWLGAVREGHLSCWYALAGRSEQAGEEKRIF